MERPQDFLVCATPGAGKTTFALTLARRLLDAGVIRRIAVVVPTDGLRTQWVDQALVKLMPVGAPEDYSKNGYEGFVATYQQLAYGATGMDLCRRATGIPTLAVLDEVHHAGESKSWGDGLWHALELAKHRLALTGTPWRSDSRSPIPFVRYDDYGRVVVDTGYEYGEAVIDGVCRRLEFHAYDGSAQWQDCGKAVSADLSAGDLTDEDLSMALDTALNPNHDWMPGVLSRAHTSLMELREEVPDAGGLVVAHDEWRARGYAKLLKIISGEEPALVVSADPDARQNLRRYREGRSPWLVAIRMVSEGVDVPRLAVGVYASKIKTPLFFRQVAGRFVRVRKDEEINARLFLPAVPSLMLLAKDVENELRHQLEIAEQSDAQRAAHEGSDSGQGIFDLRSPIAASEPVFDSAIFAGQSISPVDFARAQDKCREVGIPLQYAANLVPLLQPAATSASGSVAVLEKPETPQYARERLLRQQVESMARRVAYRAGRTPKDVNVDLVRATGVRRAGASIDQLEKMRTVLQRWIDQA
jgi:superfamily II DNA or RNA helicase